MTPTNLLYNVVASPGAIWRYRRQGQTGGPLSWLLLAGTLPGVVAGSVIRVYLLPGPVVFDFVVAAVMMPLGGFLLLAPPAPVSTDRPSYERQDPGSRAYASAGLPGADWWVADRACGAPHDAAVELGDVHALYTENGLWPAVFESNT